MSPLTCRGWTCGNDRTNIPCQCHQDFAKLRVPGDYEWEIQKTIMSGKSRLDRVYAQLMSDHPYGWGLYKKVTTRDLHPGSCGYFDSEGDWNTIIDLSDPQNLTTQGWTTPDDQLQDSEGPKSAIWGPKTSSSIRSCRIGGTAGGTSVVPCMLVMNIYFL